MKLLCRILSFTVIMLVITNDLSAQLQVTENNNAVKLAKYLVGSGVVINNASLKCGTNVISTGTFLDTRGGIIGIDSGVVLTTGRVKTDRGDWGVDGDGSFAAADVTADAFLGIAGDSDLANILVTSVNNLHDAVVLQFDFVPLGDTIKFRYVMGSEEYTPDYVCQFNDAFAFFISGPGITGKKNIALVPNTTTPVSIRNVNNIPSAPNGACVNNPAYFVNSTSNRFFTYDGHTTVLTAVSAVQPCQVYTLKLVISDLGDFAYDSGVFLEAKSLSSNSVKLSTDLPVDLQGNPFVVEGCTTGTVTVRRPYASPGAMPVTLTFGGTAINGIDVQTVSNLAIIPSNTNSVSFNLNPVIDNLPEGIEDFVIYVNGGCSTALASDSLHIQVRDYDTLAIAPRQKGLCRGNTIQLIAAAGYATYTWDNNATLSSTGIYNPVAAPVNDSTYYFCSAVLGNCHARDSALIKIKTLEKGIEQGVNCRNDATGILGVEGGWEWDSPSLFSINNLPYQADSIFNNLTAGNYLVKIKDRSGCVDSARMSIIQLFPDLIQQAQISAAGCSGLPDGGILIHASGGKAPYWYSIDAGLNNMTDSLFNVVQGNYQLLVTDNNGCRAAQPVTVSLNDTVTLVKSNDAVICEGKSQQLSVATNAASVNWSPAATLNNPAIKNPVATPVFTTKYYVTAKTGICTHNDSVVVFVNPAPVADAGPDTSICFGGNIRLNAGGGIFYKWFPASYLNGITTANPVATAPATIYYMLNVADNNGCVSLHPDTMKLTVVPAVKLFAGNDTVAAINQPVQLTVSDVNHSGVIDYSWFPSYGLNNAFIANPVAVLNRDITYTVTGRTALGCTGYDEIRIKTYKGPEIYMPNAFTPNNDGLNDILRAITAGVKSLLYLRIYDRWGKLVFYTTDSAIGWDGKIKGMPSSSGTFVWMAEAVDYLGNKIQRKGTVMIVK